MEHLEIQSAWLYLPRPEAMKLYTFSSGSTKMRCELAITAAAQKQYRILNGTCSFFPAELAKGMKSQIEIWNTDDPKKNEDQMNSMWDSHEKKAARVSGYNAFELKTRIEQSPNPDSRITLMPERDQLGMPRAQLNWALTPLEKHSIRTFYQLVARQVGQQGVGRIKLMDYLQDPNDPSWPDFTSGGWHHMGTTRMSNHPQTGVVDANCKLHGVSNLYIAGASCFVTAAAPNPTPTIVALSLRLSDHLKNLSHSDK